MTTDAAIKYGIRAPGGEQMDTGCDIRICANSVGERERS
jgi:hypothetical protein